jgi:subtilisin family serine protease
MRRAKSMKLKKFATTLLLLLLSATLNISFTNNTLTCHSNIVAATEGTSFQPSPLNTTTFDENQNKIADSLENLSLIASQPTTYNKTSLESYDSPPVYVTVMLKAKPTLTDINTFTLSGGILTTDLWDSCIYGFGGLIPRNKINSFSTSCPNLLLIEQEATSHSYLAYATAQVGARNYVWNTLGYLGDPTSAIAVIDTGIDSSHVDFPAGYGDKDFSKKIVGWNDQVSTSTNPYDDNGHGSHCSGIASGDGFYSADTQGNAQTTWSGNLGAVSSSGTYYMSGAMINKTGFINLTVRWANTGTAKLSAINLYYGGKTLNPSSWTPLSTVNTPSQNILYTLTYNVASTPTSGYDLYHVLMTLTRGTGSLYVAYNSSWPYYPPTDNHPAWSGIAPQSKLVGVKVLDNTGSGTSNQILNGINWIINNRVAYHITVTSMSLGFQSEVAAIDSAVVNLVNSGITTVVAAGNSGAGTNYIYSPGSVDEALTVSAINQFDGISSYSSQGGTSRYSGTTIKPDIAAPGGSFFAAPIFSADTNANDAEGKWADLQTNDATPMQGTSMATPLVAGAVNILVQVMGGYNNWLWTRNQALQPKMLLLMTSTETYPNGREQSSYSPTLDRGGKDSQEGYGRMNLDTAVDALTKSYLIGSIYEF